MPDWAPVEHDPFAAPGARAAPPVSAGSGDWAPVEHDPFAKAAPAASVEQRSEHEPGVFETMATDIHNQRAAVSQGTTPNVAAHAENLISDNVMEGDDGNLHYVDSEGRLQPTDTNKHVALRDPADQKIKIYARTENTDEGRLSSLGRLLGIGMGAERVPGIVGTGKVAPSAASAVEAAGRIGIKLPRAIASDSHNVNFVGQMVNKAPGGGPLQKSIGEGLESLGGTLARTSERAGGVADTKRAGEAVTTGLEEGFKPRTQQLVSQLYDRVDTLIDPKATAPLSNTQKTVGDILARKQAYGNEDLGPAVNTVAGALKRPGGLTYAAIKDLRSSIGEMIDNKFLPPTISQKELKGIYASLSEDLGNAAEVAGGSRAKVAWRVANDASKARSDALETLNKVVGPKTRSDETVMDTLHRMAGTGAGADIDTLTATRKALSGTPGAWNDVASTVIGRLGKNSQGEFSPALFVRDYGDLSGAGKRMLFHSVGKGDVIPFLDDIAQVSKKYVDAGKLANTSGTAGHAAGMAVAGAVMAGIAHVSWVEPVTALGTVIGSNVTARILGAPATAASMARWTRAYDNLVRLPSDPRNLAAFNMASRNLGGTTAASMGDPTLAPRLTEQIKGAARQSNERPNQ